MRPVIITLISLIVTVISCNNRENEIDAEINSKIEQVINQNNPHLWTMIESEFYKRLTALGLLTDKMDTLDAFYSLIKFVQMKGYPNEFYIDNADGPLVNNLNEIGFKEEDESAQIFLHNICKPIVDKLDYLNKDDIIYSYVVYNPDSVKISFDLTAALMPTNFRRPNLRKPGLYKVLLLFYFSRMIRKDKGKYLQYPHPETLSKATNLDSSQI